ncbi:MAG: glycosyltransferase family 39 protein [Verrucomicrobia bacterium]|nr:glycosyltransferase family 39 protein [Verrucomicrobiota bacterium]
MTNDRPAVLVVIALIWAGIYLPGLGSLELKHEEPRRALPAVHMAASGDWIVPRVGSVPYLRKPPLLNWLIAAGFELSGGRSEWAVRLPSALATLALALAMLIFGGRWLGLQGGFIAAVFFLTNLAIVESGRLAELEAVYIALTGIALVIWLWSWLAGRTGWRLWFWPAIFLALGLLTKGPTHLIFFYGILIPVLVYAKELRILLQPSHWFALALMVAIFSAWAVPCSLAVGQHGPLSVWQFWIRQITSRASETEAFRLQNWLLNFPQTLKNFLPWTPLLLLLWVKKEQVAAPRSRALFKGARLGMVITCLVMCVLPNGSPRYIYPLFVVPCLLLAQLFVEHENVPVITLSLRIWHWFNALLLGVASVVVLAIPFVAGFSPASLIAWIIGLAIALYGWVLWRYPRSLPGAPTRFLTGNASAVTDSAGRSLPLALEATRQALTTAMVFVIAMMTYASAIVPRVNALTRDGPREVAAEIRRAVPSGIVLWVQEDQYRPFWYYLEPGARYFHSLSDIPDDARYFLLPQDSAADFMRDQRWKGDQLKRLKEVSDNENKKFVVIAK